MKKIVLLCLIFVFIFPCAVYSFDTGEFDMAYSFNENGVARVLLSEKWGLLSANGDMLMPFDYDYIGEKSDGLIKIKKGSLFGYADGNYSTIISPAFYNADNFSEGCAAVKNSDGKWGYILKDGSFLTDFQFDEAYPFSDGLARIKLSGFYGYIDKNGSAVISPKYVESYDFSCGLACVCLNGKYGYIDKNGDLKIDATYDFAWDFCENFAAVKSNGIYSFIDTNGNVKITGNFDRATRFSNGLAPVRYANGKYGLINTSGNLTVQHKYDSIGEFCDGLACVRLNDKYGYINSAGILVIPMLFDQAGDFYGGYARAGTKDAVGYIDKSGKYVISPEFSDGGSYSSGFVNVRFSNGLWGYINIAESVKKQESETENNDEKSLSSEQGLFSEQNSPAVSFNRVSNGTGVIKLKIGSTAANINGKSISLASAPVISNDRTLLPIRAVVEAAGGKISWNEKEKKVSIFYDEKNIILTVGSTACKVNGVVSLLDASPVISNGATLLPLRFIAEQMGMGITWLEDTSEILLYY